ncbi:hypothetical protein [Photorhabdus viridis]|uniref:hypothetical protein n=1 Tax=Photorhabdus viridis TaxID=3163327 RepID=UPI0033073A0F
MTINNMTVRMGNHEDSAVINNIELQAACLFPDELLPKALCDKTLPLYEIKSAIQEQQLWIAEIDQKQVGFALILYQAANYMTNLVLSYWNQMIFLMNY